MQGPKSKSKYSEDAHDVSKVNTSSWSHDLTQLWVCMFSARASLEPHPEIVCCILS